MKRVFDVGGIKFESQSQIFGIAIKNVETAQYYLRQAILKNDPRFLTKVFLALHFVYKHATQKDLSPTVDVFLAVTKMSRYLMTKQTSLLLEANRLLERARGRLYDLMHFARLQRLPPSSGDMPGWGKGFYFNTELFAEDLAYAAWAAIQLFWVLYPLAKAPAAIKKAMMARGAIREAERLLREHGPVIRREVPHLWKMIQEIIKDIKGYPK